MVGDGDHVRLVLDDQHRVALVAQLLHQPGQPPHIVRMQPHRGFVEHIGDVGQRRAEMAHHLDPLALPARQARALAVKAEIAEPDGDEIVEPRRQGRQHRLHLRRLDGAHQRGEVAHLHRRHFGDILAGNLARQRLRLEPRALAGGAELAREDAVVLDPHMGLQRLGILAAQHLLELGHHALIGEVDLVDLDLAPVIEIEEVGAFLLRVFADRLVEIEQAGAGVDAPTTSYRPRKSLRSSAPWLSDLLSSTTAAMSMAATWPMPSQSGHMPRGSL